MLVWRKKYSIGVSRLDADHLTLVSLLNQLHINMAEELSREAVEPVLAALQCYSEHHFDFEESLMVKFGYPELDFHRACHDSFCRQVTELARDAHANHDEARGLRAQLGRCLLDHVVTVDGRFGTWLKANRITVPTFHRSRRAILPPADQRQPCHA